MFKMQRLRQRQMIKLSKWFTGLCDGSPSSVHIELGKSRFHVIGKLENVLKIVDSKHTPAITTAFRNGFSNPTLLPELDKCMKTSAKALESLQNIAHKIVLEKGRNITTNSMDSARNYLGEHCLTILERIQNDNDLNQLIACMTLVAPRSEKTWLDFDEALSRRVSCFGIDSVLLGTHSLACVTRDRRMKHTRHKTHKAVLDIVMAWYGRAKVVDSQTEGNVFNQLLRENPGGFELGRSVGIADSATGVVSRVEQLGFVMQLLAYKRADRIKLSEDHPLFDDMCVDLVEHGTRTLSSLPEGRTVPLTTLQIIWESASRAALPNAFPFFKSLFNQVRRSLAADPLQLTGREETVVSLLDAMLQARFKDSVLIGLIAHETEARGMDYHAVGMPLFSALVELGALPFAVRVLQRLTDGSSGDLELIFSGNLRSRGFSLSDAALDRAVRVLQDGTGAYTSADLILALLCFNRDVQVSPRHRLMVQIEAEVVQSVSGMRVHEALSLLHAYGLAGRAFPDILVAIDDIVLRAATSGALSAKQSGTALWAYARLNWHNSAVVGPLAALFFNDLAGRSMLSHHGMQQLARTLWSLAALQRLQWRHLVVACALMRPYLRRSDGWETSRLASRQLAQVAAELSIIRQSTRREDSVEGDVSEREKSDVEAFLREKFPPARVAHLSREESLDTASSYSHRQLSRVLDEMGVAHQNEAVVGDSGYVVDMLIPPEEEQRGGDSSRGTVVEVDGPTHFESYLQQPLGATAMKRRHLTAMGYRVVSIPFWAHAAKCTDQERRKVLRAALTKGL